jgi:restriction system protein
MDVAFHYPPELFNLLIETIPSLCRSKRDVILFFKGAGVSSNLTNDLVRKINKDKDGISKYEITRVVLTRLNEKGEATLRERREILKRITDFENFSTCWPNDQMKAKGQVAEVRRIIGVKDAFTRMNLEREAERQQRLEETRAKQKEDARRRERIASIKAELFALFKESDSQKRGKALEKVLNRLFDVEGILIQEAFTIKGNNKEGIVEQIDGVIEVGGKICLVEMKWWNEPLGTGEISPHIVRVFGRDQSCGIFISNSDYTAAALQTCREALPRKVIALCKLEEIVFLLEREGDLAKFLKDKITAAIVHKNPLYEPLKEYV